MQLVVQSGAEPGRTYDLKPGKLTLGRQSVNDIVISDEQASRRHSDLEISPNGLIVTDNNSANGTFVNGTRISSPQLLKPGDTLQIGTTVLKLVDGQSGTSTIPSGYEQPAPAAPVADSPYGGSFGQAPSGPYGTSTPVSSTPDYNAAAYSAPAQPQVQYGGYDQNQQAYGQQPQPQYGAYDQSQQAYGQQPQPQYGAYDPNQQAQFGATPAVPAKKSNGLLLGIIGGVVAIIVIVAVLFLFVFKGSSSGGSADVGDLAKPANSEKVDVSVDDLAKLGSGTTSIPKGASFGIYVSTDKPADIEAAYKKSMKDKGYDLLPTSATATAAGMTNSTLNFKKGNTGAGAFILGPLDALTIPAFESAIPPLKGKLKAGGTLVILASADAKDMGAGFQ
jgi:pSer/pThr/pTyr-binding forkhead associated (FHA) protein